MWGIIDAYAQPFHIAVERVIVGNTHYIKSLRVTEKGPTTMTIPWLAESVMVISGWTMIGKKRWEYVYLLPPGFGWDTRTILKR